MVLSVASGAKAGAGAVRTDPIWVLADRVNFDVVKIFKAKTAETLTTDDLKLIFKCPASLFVLYKLFENQMVHCVLEVCFHIVHFNSVHSD